MEPPNSTLYYYWVIWGFPKIGLPLIYPKMLSNPLNGTPVKGTLGFGTNQFLEPLRGIPTATPQNGLGFRV